MRSGTVTKVADILMFLVKSHLYGNIDKLFSVLELLSPHRKKPDESPDRDA